MFSGGFNQNSTFGNQNNSGFGNANNTNTGFGSFGQAPPAGQQNTTFGSANFSSKFSIKL